MRFAAVADVHGDEHLPALEASLTNLVPPDVFLLGGDMTDGNDLSAYGRVLEVIRSYHRGPIVAVFGNNEYAPDYPKYRAAFPQVRFLQDEVLDLALDDHRVSIVGTLGSLDKPTSWQMKHLPNIREEYERRVHRVRELLLGARGELRILLMHYAPTFITMVGEAEWYWDQLGSRKYEEVILATRPDAVLHGHVHNGKPMALLRPTQRTLGEDFRASGGVPIYNIAFAERHEITILKLEPGSRESL